MTQLETITVLATAISGESGVGLGNALEMVRNALQAASYEPEPHEDEVTLEDALQAAMLHRITWQPQDWKAVARADVPRLARAAVDALNGELRRTA